MRAWVTALLLSVAARGHAAPRVFVVDDGEKVKRDALDLPFATGADNPVWRPGDAARLFALRDETVALQVVVQADAALDGVTVTLERLVGPGGATLANAPDAGDPARLDARVIERFVEHFVYVARASATKSTAESLGWAAGSGPPPRAWTGWVPDALIPVELAPSWAPYPLRIARATNGVVWIDITVPREQRPGVYRGDVVVAAAGATLATLPVELEVLDRALPDRAVRTMLFYDRAELDPRLGGSDVAETRLWQLFRRHRVTPLHDVRSAGALAAHLPALDGSLYTAARGYGGPGAGAGDGVLALGAYGKLAPDAASLRAVEAIADALAARGVLASTDVFVYAADEECASPRGAAWKSLLASSANANARRVRVAWTCSEPPASQPVDVPIVLASAYDVRAAAAARAAGKEVWIYNGVRPRTGAFLLDDDAVSPRVNGWIAGAFGVQRWFYWESTFWYDDNRGGRGLFDPFVEAETFHNVHGDECQGDGVLVYPGTQREFAMRSLGFDGVLPSIRLKNWRRGIEDAGYLELARAIDAPAADAIVHALLPSVLAAATPGDPPSWPARGRGFFEARRELAALLRGEHPAPRADVRANAVPMARGGSMWWLLIVAGVVLLLLLQAVLLIRRRSRG
jgi:Glycoside hydrolase 123, catalytic domain